MVSTAYFVLSFLLGLAIGVSYFIANDVVLIVTWHLVYNVISMTVICKYPRLIMIADD